MLKIINVFLIVFFMASFSFADILTKRQFTEEYIDIVKKQNRLYQFDLINDLEVGLIKRDELTAYSFLFSAYDEYLKKPSKKNYILRSKAVTIKDDIVAAKLIDVHSLMPIIKSSDYLNEVKKKVSNTNFKNKKLPIYYQNLTDNLIVVFAYKKGGKLMYLSPAVLNSLAYSDKGLLALAKQNLRNYFDRKFPNKQKFESLVEGKSLYTLRFGEEYESSVVLLERFWNSSSLPFSGDPLVAVPANGIIFVTNSTSQEDADLIQHFANQANKDFKQPITTQVYKRVNGNLVPVSL